MISPAQFVALAMESEHRFWLKVDKSGGIDACWPWMGANDGRRGYGKFKIASHESARSHRVAYALEFGPIPEGLDVLHECDNPPCCNAKHLFLGDHTTNMADMAYKGRAWTDSGAGELNHRAILTADNVEMIKRRIMSGETNVSIAKDYGVGDDIISRIRRGKAWGDGTPMQPRYASLRRA